MKTVEGQKRKGFASLDPERRREIASMGGSTAHQKGTAHKFNSVTGSAAVQKKLAAMKALKT